MRPLREIPPTAGLPLQAADLLPRRDALITTLAAQLGTRFGGLATRLSFSASYPIRPETGAALLSALRA